MGGAVPRQFGAEDNGKRRLRENVRNLASGNLRRSSRGERRRRGADCGGQAPRRDGNAVGVVTHPPSSFYSTSLITFASFAGFLCRCFGFPVVILPPLHHS